MPPAKPGSVTPVVVSLVCMQSGQSVAWPGGQTGDRRQCANQSSQCTRHEYWRRRAEPPAARPVGRRRVDACNRAYRVQSGWVQYGCSLGMARWANQCLHVRIRSSHIRTSDEAWCHVTAVRQRSAASRADVANNSCRDRCPIFYSKDHPRQAGAQKK